MRTANSFVLLFAVASAVALASRRLRVPYTVALVLAGIGLGATEWLAPPHLTRELLYAVFLPGLVFEAAYQLKPQQFWRNKYTILGLAVPGLLAVIAFTALVVASQAGLSRGAALAFAALISATDPIAVIALFRSLGAPERLTLLVEGESLFNDGTAVVAFTIALGVLDGGAVSFGGAALELARAVGLGAATGLAVGFVASRAIALVDESTIEITLTTVAAYGSFAAAEELRASGIIATLASGMLCGSYGASKGMSRTTREAVDSFWQYVAFALNSIVFLLIGFEVHASSLVRAWRPIAIAYGAVVVGRAVVVAIATILLHRSKEAIPWSWAAMLTWGGLRGALGMVLALSLPATFPERETVVSMTFGVVVISLLAQGLSAAPLLRALELTR